jgi:hypothetical protein
MDYPGDEAPRLTVKQGFDALRHFLEAYWERGQRSSDDLAVLLGSLDGEFTSDGRPLDAAQWDDWVNAVRKAEREGGQLN